MSTVRFGPLFSHVQFRNTNSVILCFWAQNQNPTQLKMSLDLFTVWLWSRKANLSCGFYLNNMRSRLPAVFLLIGRCKIFSWCSEDKHLLLKNVQKHDGEYVSSLTLANWTGALNHICVNWRGHSSVLIMEGKAKGLCNYHVCEVTAHSLWHRELLQAQSLGTEVRSSPKTCWEILQHLVYVIR